jgi:hypothetical protein
MQDPPAQFEIRLDPETSKATSRYVVRGFFTPREFPQAFWRFLFTREFLLPVGIPGAIVLTVNLLPLFSTAPVLETVLVAGTAVGVAWMLGGLVWSLSLGKSIAIGCFAPGENGERTRLVGGLRLKAASRRRRLCLAGALVDPGMRGKRVFTALMVAALRLAREEAARGPVIVTPFAPTHPASVRLVNKYLGGVHRLAVDPAPDSAFSKALDRLEAELRALEDDGVRYRFNAPMPEGGLF